MRILVVEDTADVAEGILAAIRRLGHVVEWARTGDSGDELLHGSSYDLLVLDLMLPGETDGVQLLRNLRDRGSKIPVLILTGRSAISERVHLLDLGADDYLCKPFDFSELQARIRSLLRRQSDEKTNHLQCGGLAFDRTSRIATADGMAIGLSQREASLLEMLLVSRGRILSKSKMLDSLFDWRSEPTENAVEVLVGRLRRKLVDSKVEICNHRGLGYQLRTRG